MISSMVLTYAGLAVAASHVSTPDLPVPLVSLLEWIGAEAGRPPDPSVRIEVVREFDALAIGALGNHENAATERDAWVEGLCPSPPRIAENQISNLAALAREFARSGCGFDPAARTLFVAGSAAKIDTRELIRALVRATIDKQVDWVRFVSSGEDPDARAARRLVLIGLSEFLARRVIARRATALTTAVGVESIGASDVRSRLAKSEASPFFVEKSASEIEAGLRFVERAYAESGSEGLRRLISAPPRSTEQVVEPEKWLGIEPRDEPRLPEERDLLSSLPEGSTRVVSTALGAFEAEIVLRLGGDPIRAFRACRRIDGDRLVGYTVGDDRTRLLQWRVRCDDEADTATFLHAVRKLCEKQMVEPPRDSGREPGRIEFDDPITKLVVTGRNDEVTRAIAWSDGATVELLFVLEGEFDLGGLAPR